MSEPSFIWFSGFHQQPNVRSLEDITLESYEVRFLPQHRRGQGPCPISGRVSPISLLAVASWPNRRDGGRGNAFLAGCCEGTKSLDLEASVLHATVQP